jgi:release factor glutamine methyltransferase
MSIPPEDFGQPVTDHEIELVWRDKYHQMSKDLLTHELAADKKRLEAGEPLAYVIGWIPFLDLTIKLDSKPLIPRPETEWWTEKLISHLTEKFGDGAFSLLDLCAGSGAIGLAILKKFPNARVTFAEISANHCSQIVKNADINNIARNRIEIFTSDLFSSLPTQRFNIIATNPPYIPTSRKLGEEVISYEPKIALYAGVEGLDLIRTILMEADVHLTSGSESGSELWMECDISNIERGAGLARITAQEVTIHEDLYGRPRLIVAHFT